MGVSDVTTNEYLDTRERVADLLNGFVYHGKELVRPEHVKQMKNVLSCTERQKVTRRSRRKGGEKQIRTVTVDAIREVEHESKAMRAVIVMLENQTDIHYAMPIRALNLEAIAYHTQWRQAAKEHSAKKDLSGAEYLSGFAKNEKVKPVLLVVLYWGQEPWNGPRNLKDMIDFGDYPEELRKLILDYPLHLIEARQYERTGEFKTDLKYVFGFLQHDNDIDGLKRYLEENEQALCSLAPDAYDAISAMSHSEELRAARDKYQVMTENGRRQDMCKAIKGMIKEGEDRGMQQGMQRELVKSIDNVMKNLHLDLQAACAAFEVSISQYETARKATAEKIN